MAGNWSLGPGAVEVVAAGSGALVVTPFAVGNLVGGVLVCLGNGLILLATARSPALRGNCNILIAVLALMDLVSGAAFVQQALLILSGNLHFPRRLCGLIWSPLFFSLDAGSGLILGVGFDRFVSLRFPIWYKNLNRRVYLGTILCLSLGFGLSVAVAAVTQTDSTRVACIPPTALQGGTFLYWIGSNLMINIAVVLIYMLAFRRAKELRDAEEASGVEVVGSGGVGLSRKTEQRHAIMLSLVLVVHIYMASWLATMFILGVSSILPLHPRTRFHIQAYCGWLVLVNVGSNAWIYAWRSELYRRAMADALRRRGRKRGSAEIPLADPRPPSYGLLHSPPSQPLPLSVTYAEPNSYISTISSPEPCLN